MTTVTNSPAIILIPQQLRENAMLFGGIDWNQVMIQGLIGGAIGAGVGLILFLAKKMGGGGGKKGGPPGDNRTE
jgi:Flp pilus assembly protein protease CpaA